MKRILLAVLVLATAVGAQTDISVTPWAWWCADSITGLSDGNDVSLWENLQGDAGRDLSNAVSIFRPHWFGNVVNGHAIVRFSPSISEYLRSTEYPDSGESHIFIVKKSDNDPAATAGSSGLWHIASANNGSTHNVRHPDTAGDLYEVYGRRNIATALLNFGNPDSTLGVWRCYNVEVDTNFYRVRIDTAVVASLDTTGIPAYTNATTFVTVGISLNQAVRFDGDIAEIRIYQPRLTTSQFDSVMSFFAVKYDLNFEPYSSSDSGFSGEYFFRRRGR